MGEGEFAFAVAAWRSRPRVAREPPYVVRTLRWEVDSVKPRQHKNSTPTIHSLPPPWAAPSNQTLAPPAVANLRLACIFIPEGLQPLARD